MNADDLKASLDYMAAFVEYDPRNEVGAVYEGIELLLVVADAAREVERILRQSGVRDSRIAELRTALAALSSEDATRPTGEIRA